MKATQGARQFGRSKASGALGHSTGAEYSDERTFRVHKVRAPMDGPDRDADVREGEGRDFGPWRRRRRTESGREMSLIWKAVI